MMLMRFIDLMGTLGGAEVDVVGSVDMNRALITGETRALGCHIMAGL